MRKLLKVAGYVARGTGLCLLAIILVPLLIAASECRYLGRSVTPAAQSAAVYPSAVKDAVAKLDYRRLEDQTFLTLPEWYIVYSADEYGAFISRNKPSAFPYVQSIVQYWDGYYRICAHTRDTYAFNSGYQVMLGVIGSSFTLEYAVKYAYESTIGRLAELTSSGPTEEERYAAAVASEFGTFIHTIPWFDFPYMQKLRGLWSQTSLWGPNPIRKWERKLALSAEYLFKASYGAILARANSAAYGVQVTEILAIVEDPPPGVIERYMGARIVSKPAPGYAVLAIPHYEAFTKLMPGLLRDGVRVVEIAGSDDIMVTVIAPADWTYTASAGKFLFGMNMLTEPGKRRGVISVPVAQLHSVFAELDRQNVTVEHVYDY